MDVSKSLLCSTGHRPFGVAALLSLHLFTGSLPAVHRGPLTMCDSWMTIIKMTDKMKNTNCCQYG